MSAAENVPDIQPPEIGYGSGTEVAGRYTIERFVGAGGMGWVFSAADRELNGETVALKLVYPHLLAQPSSIDLLRHEILISRRLTHPNIVQIYSFGEIEAGRHFVAMELIDGLSLAQLLQLHAKSSEGGASANLPAALLDQASYRERFSTLVADFVRAMAHAHHCGVVHCDLKPDNLLLTSGGVLKVADFGLARVLRNEHREPGDTRMVGTPYYMAPEQFRSLPADNRTDIYSFGIVLFELWTGRRPFEENSLYRLAQQHLTEPVPLEELERCAAPEWLRELIRRCTEKDAEARIQSFHDVWMVLVANGLASESELLLLTHSTAAPTVRAFDLNQRYRFRPSPFAVSLLLTLFLFTLGIGFTRTNNSVWWRVGGVFLIIEKQFGTRLSPIRSILAIPLDMSDTNAFWEPPRERPAALLLAGFDPNIRQRPGGDTPLLYAIRSGLYLRANLDKTRVRRLLNAGADPNLPDANGNTALHLACGKNLDFPVDLLLQHHADAHARNDCQRSPLHIAVQERSYRPMKLLLDAGADINAQDIRGFTPLHYAAAGVDSTSIQTLIDSSALVNIVDNEGRSPLTLLVEAAVDAPEVTKLVSLFIAKGAVIDLKDRRGWTPRKIAASRKLASVLAVMNGALPPPAELAADVPLPDLTAGSEAEELSNECAGSSIPALP